MTQPTKIMIGQLLYMLEHSSISYADENSRTLVALKQRAFVTYSRGGKYGKAHWSLTDLGTDTAKHLLAKRNEQRRVHNIPEDRATKPTLPMPREFDPNDPVECFGYVITRAEAAQLGLTVNPKGQAVHITRGQWLALCAMTRREQSKPNVQNIPVRTEDGREIRQAFTGGVKTGWDAFADAIKSKAAKGEEL